MTYGKNGSMCWLAGAVRTLQKRVELLEAATNEAECKDDDLHDFNQILSDDPCVPRQKTVQVVEKTIEIPQLQTIEKNRRCSRNPDSSMHRVRRFSCTCLGGWASRQDCACSSGASCREVDRDPAVAFS